MGRYPRQEIEDALSRYRTEREQACRSGDWSGWADCFTEDALYIEHAYGEFRGRQAIAEWISAVMAPFPDMTFPEDWCVIDEANDAVVFQCQNRLPHPTDPDGAPFEFPTWTRLVYGGDGRWCVEEDVYNPARDAGRVIQAWRAAGGRFAGPEQVAMSHRAS